MKSRLHLTYWAGPNRHDYKVWKNANSFFSPTFSLPSSSSLLKVLIVSICSEMVTSTAIETRSSQSIKIGIDLSIDKSIKIGKSDLIDIDCIDQSVEIDGGGWGDDNQAMFHSISLICLCHQSPFVVMLFLYQICFCF